MIYKIDFMEDKKKRRYS